MFLKWTSLSENIYPKLNFKKEKMVSFEDFTPALY